MMVRSFLAVGQGAFYCESFEIGNSDSPFNVVYDCGSMPNKEVVNEAIRHNFQKGEEIHAVFISHLHEDHINGIPYLLKHCKVKRIYFPVILSENKILMKIWYSINGISGFTVDFLENPIQAIESLGLDDEHRPKLIQIKEAGLDSEERDFRETDSDGGKIIEESGGVTLEEIESGKNVFKDIIHTNPTDAYGEWKYIPFNFRQEGRIKILMKALESLLGKPATAEKLEQVYKRIMKKNEDENTNENMDENNISMTDIEDAYKQVLGEFNTNSMTLFSGEIQNRYEQFLDINDRLYACCCYRPKHSGCLYTGDYDALGKIKWNQLKKAYKKYWKYIGCVQIPHHGSRHSFNNEFLEMDAVFVISAGYSNQFKHPHSCVMKSCMQKGIKPHIVTEDIGSTLYLLIK